MAEINLMGDDNNSQDEDASSLIFPKEFEEAEPLSNSEVHMVLERRHNQNAEEEIELPEIIHRTFDYTQNFRKFRNKDSNIAVRKLLMEKPLHKYEVVALANLCPDTADEATSIVPSLEGRFRNQELQGILDDLNTKKSLQY